MTLSHSVTVADVKRLYAEEADVVLPDGNKRTPAEVLQGTRTRVHELIASQSPCTYVLRAPVRAFAHHEHTARDADTTARKAELAASIPEALIIESERARKAPRAS